MGGFQKMPDFIDLLAGVAALIAKSIIITILDVGIGIHEFYCRLMTLRNRIFVLNANASEGLYIVTWCCNPAEALAKGVVRIHNIPMTRGVRHRDGAFGPVVIPLRNLDKRQHREQETEECGKHESNAGLKILTCLAGSPTPGAVASPGRGLMQAVSQALCGRGISSVPN
jgi:hypothetical protein